MTEALAYNTNKKYLSHSQIVGIGEGVLKWEIT
jgi:hypothetical protein